MLKYEKYEEKDMKKNKDSKGKGKATKNVYEKLDFVLANDFIKKIN